jgi:hypothetical protein
MACFLLQLLGAQTQKFYSSSSAPGATLRNWHPVVALVADQNILSQVIAERNLATPTAEDKTTAATLDKGGGSPPIEKEDDLFPFYHRLAHRLG